MACHESRRSGLRSLLADSVAGGTNDPYQAGPQPLTSDFVDHLSRKVHLVGD